MMMILKELGIPIIGDKWPMKKRFDERVQKETDNEKKQKLQKAFDKRFKKTKSMNPLGFYEVPGVVMQGTEISDEDFSGKAIKIMTNGARPRIIEISDKRMRRMNAREKLLKQRIEKESDETKKERLQKRLENREKQKAEIKTREDGSNYLQRGTPMDSVDRIILALRDPLSVSKSQTKLQPANGMEVFTAETKLFEGQANPHRYAIELGLYAGWLSEQDDSYLSKLLVIDYDELVEDREENVDRIINHLDIGNSKRQDAIGIIKPKLRRSKQVYYPPQYSEAGGVADQVYAALSYMNRNGLRLAGEAAKELQRKKQLESVRWYDHKTGLNTNAKTHEKYRYDKKFRDMQKNSYQNLIAQGMHPVSSPDWKLSNKTYTIETPEGGLTLQKVTYKGQLMRPAAAFKLHNRLRLNDKAKLYRRRKRKQIASQLLGTE